MSRIVVLGAAGFFGAAALRLLRERGLEPLAPARSDADASSPGSLRAYLQPGDVVVDAAGPYQGRGMALVDAAAEVGADVVDLCDALDYAVEVAGRRERIETAGTRVVNCCSSVSVVTAAMVEASGVTDPRRVSVCLAPASRQTSTPGTAASVLRSVGAPIRLRRGGGLVTRRGWSEHRDFHMPLGRGRVRGYLTESADAVTLPVAWPGLADVDFWVDTNAPGANGVLRVASQVPGGGGFARRMAPMGVWLARRLGSSMGGVGVEVAGGGGEVWRSSLTARRRSYLVAVLPAVLAVEAIVAGRQPLTGLVPVNRQVPAVQLIDGLRALDIEVVLGAP
ncbi:MAG TPA: hypothetical protein VG329_08020 [Candidatus Dormibacteraeota bacterium]|nr:hypothetical protein [Candidatus Dormibacteraeota bacterium]